MGHEGFKLPDISIKGLLTFSGKHGGISVFNQECLLSTFTGSYISR